MTAVAALADIDIAAGEFQGAIRFLEAVLE
jgi:hypothetical protein